MKKIILLALTALMMVGCNKKELKETTEHTTESLESMPILRRGMIVNIDSCQYVVCDAYGGWAYVHHGNCRFCKERDSIKWEKRKKELEELVIKLKEK